MTTYSCINHQWHLPECEGCASAQRLAENFLQALPYSSPEERAQQEKSLGEVMSLVRMLGKAAASPVRN